MTAGPQLDSNHLPPRSSLPERCRDLNVRASRPPSPHVLASVLRENRPCPVGQPARVGSMVEPTTTVSEIEADDAAIGF